MKKLRHIFFKKKKSKQPKKKTQKKSKKSKNKLFTKIKALFSRKKTKPTSRRKKIFYNSLVILAIVSLLVYAGVFPFYKCETDQCLNDALIKCKPITYEKLQNSNLYVYKVHRSLSKECRVKVTLRKMAIGSDLDLLNLLEGKEMICNMPRNEPESIKKLNYCTGPLKEGLQQVLIQRVYGLLIKDIPEILEKV